MPLGSTAPVLAAERSATLPSVAVTLGALVRSLRERKGWTQGQLSRQSGVPGGTISKLERGLVGVRDDNLTKIAQTFGMTSLELRRQAGLLSPEELNRALGLPTVEDAVNADPNLTEVQKEAVLTVYYAFLPSKKPPNW